MHTLLRNRGAYFALVEFNQGGRCESLWNGLNLEFSHGKILKFIASEMAGILEMLPKFNDDVTRASKNELHRKVLSNVLLSSSYIKQFLLGFKSPKRATAAIYFLFGFHHMSDTHVVRT